MIGPNLSGIKRKVLIIAVFPAAVVTLLLTLLFSITQTQGLGESLSERGFAIVRQLGPASEFGVFSGNQNILRSLIEAVSNEADVRSITIRNSSLNIITSSGPAPHTSLDLTFSVSEPRMFHSDNKQSRIFVAPIYQTEFSRDELLEEEDSLILDKSIPELKQTNRLLGYVAVELSMERTYAYQFDTWFKSGLIALVVLLLSGVLAIRMGRNITVPITRLKDTVKEMEDGNLEIQVKTGADGELFALESGINTMAKSLKASRTNLEERIEQATANLLDTLHVLEERNAELDDARQEAVSANKTKSDFLANISHEIRTPLNGIQGFLMLLLKTDLSASQVEFIDKINMSTKALLTLLNDILDFSKLEATKISITHIDFDIRDLLHESISACVLEAENKNIELIVVVNADIPTRLIGGADRIAQVIKNLVSNAIKFTNHGQVVIHVSYDTQSEDKNVYRFSVTDTGIGISAQDREHLFQPFSQIESGMSRRYSGTGLGLVITKSFVELMGGEIIVDSIPDVGSCFTFTIPLNPVTPDKTDATYLKILKNKRVLVVSDKRHVTLSIAETLTHWSMVVETTNEISQATKFLGSSISSEQPYDVLVVDGSLNHKDIKNILDEAHKSTNKKTTFSILLKQSIMKSNEPSEPQHSFDCLIPKPAHPSKLISILCREFSGTFEQHEQQRDPAFIKQDKLYLTRSLQVLLADDNPINRQFLSIWLKQAGCSVDEVEDGREAIQHCTYTKFDLILIDLHMPKMDGIEAASWIRKNNLASKNTPIIAITADATENTENLIQESVLDDYLIKPVDEPELLHTIKKWCPNNYIDKAEDVVVEQLNSNISNDDPVVDVSQGLKLASGNTELWFWSLQILSDRLAKHTTELEQAINESDTQRVFDIAHDIVGAAGYCGANNLKHAAHLLEKTTQTNNAEDVISAYKKLIKESNRLIEHVKQQKIAKENKST